MELRLTINLDNDAFQDGNHMAEIAKILSRIAKTEIPARLQPCPASTLIDSNGNRCGTVQIGNFPTGTVICPECKTPAKLFPNEGYFCMNDKCDHEGLITQP